MKNDELENLERELEAKLAEMETVSSQLAAVRLTRSLLGKSGGSEKLRPPQAAAVVTALPPLGGGSDDRPRYGDVSKEIRDAVEGRTSNFKIADIEEALKAKGRTLNRVSIRTVVSRMVANKQLEIVEGGKGRKAAVYAKVRK